MAELDDMDDAPELDEAWFAEAKPMREVLTAKEQRAFKTGRPKAEPPKEQVTLRLDKDVLAKFKAGGAGWQTRINTVLRNTPPSRIEKLVQATAREATASDEATRPISRAKARKLKQLDEARKRNKAASKAQQAKHA